MNLRIVVAFAAIGIGAGSLASPAIGQVGGYGNVQTEHIGGLQFVEQGNAGTAANAAQPDTASDGMTNSFAGFDVGDSGAEDQALPQTPVGELQVTPAQPDAMAQRVESEPDVVAARNNVDRLTTWVQETQKNLDERTRRCAFAGRTDNATMEAGWY